MKHELARLPDPWIAALPLSGFSYGTWEPALLVAAALIATELMAFFRGAGVPDTLQVQVRMCCVLLLVLGSVPPFGVLYLLLSLIGVVRLILGRCLLSAILRRAPWNELPPEPGSAS